MASKSMLLAGAASDPLELDREPLASEETLVLELAMELRAVSEADPLLPREPREVRPPFTVLRTSGLLRKIRFYIHI